MKQLEKYTEGGGPVPAWETETAPEPVRRSPSPIYRPMSEASNLVRSCTPTKQSEEAYGSGLNSRENSNRGMNRKNDDMMIASIKRQQEAQERDQ